MGAAVFGLQLAIGAAIKAIGLNVLLTIGLTVATLVMAKRAQKIPDIDSNRRNMTTLRGGNESRKYVYGEARVGGQMVFADTKDIRQWEDAGKSDLFMVVALCPHHIHSYHNFYINDKDLAYFQENIQWANGFASAKEDRVDIYFHRDITTPGLLWSGTINGTVYTDEAIADFDTIVIAEGFGVDTPTTGYGGYMGEMLKRCGLQLLRSIGY